jgi:lipopolysaccharide biosynthesis glycosyltransferase
MVAKHSIERRASAPVLISPLYLPHLNSYMSRPLGRRDGKLWCPVSQAPMATEFAISRFCVPFIQREGWALFIDCDMLCLSDIAELFALADDRYAVMVIKHKQESGATTKMDGQVQTYYARKNWSSVVLWNTSHQANRRLLPRDLNSLPGRDLHAFKWLKDEEIGELPHEWNYLVGIDGAGAAKMLHFTLGGPWIRGWTDNTSDDLLWRREYASLYNHYRAVEPA